MSGTLEWAKPMPTITEGIAELILRSVVAFR
jgi:hypothetical protein